ncbi:S41 family peptidase [Aurantiacibacter marinus]|uniref:Peptidase S41 n=1 Tax=Aurantiacibacter marinus TaxID=874156 RepID=A0A0H0XK33_9SPHN|nr:S41 family peptidase [Aurantiacibacter marinus]KLI62958.1 peptidase S41 [Aurantiacibacter marinus]
MHTSKFALSLACAAMLVSCGGGGGTPTPTVGGGGGGGGIGGGGGTDPCSLTARQNFARDLLNEWYLFPNLLDTSARQSDFNSVQAYLDALVAPAREVNRDRGFTFVTSIQQENDFASSGASAGFGFRLAYDSANRRAFVIETFEGTAALGANLDRGTEILGIGTVSSNIQSVNSLFATGGARAVSDALGAATTGVTRVLLVRDQSGVQREVSLSKTTFALDPVSDRYGAQIINDGGKQVGYLNLRTFSVLSAETDLINAFADFRAAGVTELIIDFRYNGGGRISVAETFGDLLARGFDNQVYNEIAFRASKSENNSIYRFNVRPESIAPTKIAFIGTESTASASELVINGIQPYVADIALIGENTFGKPVGQSGFDLAACDDRFRPVTIQLQNADGLGEYFNGLATTVPNTCRANDDIRFQMGDPREAMTATALSFLAGRACTAIAGGPATTATAIDEGLLSPDLQDRTAAQHEVPGLY